MNTIRTTVVFDQDLHRQLSLLASALGMSFSDLVNRKLSNANAGVSTSLAQKQMADDMAFFKRLGKKAGKTDWAKLIREDRDRDSK